MDAVPLLMLHEAGVIDIVEVIAGGCVMVKVCASVHPTGPDVMVQIYTPAHNPVAVAVPCPPPGAGDQLYV
jgi:hypothetical protein